MENGELHRSTNGGGAKDEVVVYSAGVAGPDVDARFAVESMPLGCLLKEEFIGTR